MKILGFLLLVMGWAVLIAALVLFPPTALANSFVVAGLGIQSAGMALVFLGMRYRSEMSR